MDQGIKRLLERHPADLLAFAVPGAAYLGSLPGDLAMEPQRVLDLLMRVRYQGVECVVNIEAEAQPRAEIARRCFEYGARASIVTGLPVLSVVLWLQPGGTPPTSPYEMRVGDRLTALWHFTGIELYNVSAESLFTRGLPGLFPLVPFTRDGGDLTVVERAALLVRDRAPAADLAELEVLLGVFGARRFGTGTMRAVLRRVLMSTEILDTSPLYQDWKREWIAEGMAQGMAQTLRDAVLAVLRGRFGALPPEMETVVAAADTAALQAVLPRLATAPLEEITAALQARAGGK